MANDKNKVQGDQPEERLKALDAALKKIEKKFGKGSIMKMGGKVDTKISTISSGSIAIDAGSLHKAGAHPCLHERRNIIGQSLLVGNHDKHIIVAAVLHLHPFF